MAPPLGAGDPPVLDGPPPWGLEIRRPWPADLMITNSDLEIRRFQLKPADLGPPHGGQRISTSRI
eukprot:2400781-Pyramimonas_sp.AAC.1